MSLLNQIKNDIKDITGNSDEFGVNILITNGEDEATIIGVHTKHHNSIDMNTGIPINTRNAHISFAESLLSELNYPVRNSRGEVALKGHIVTVDGKSYKISENKPDETIGFIVCILEDIE